MDNAILLYGNIGNPTYYELVGYLKKLDFDGDVDYSTRATGDYSIRETGEYHNLERGSKILISLNSEFNTAIFNSIRDLEIPFTFIAVRSNRDKQSSEEIGKEICKVFPDLESRVFEFENTF